MTRWSARITAPGSPVAGSVCHAACRAGQLRRPRRLGCLGTGQALLTALFPHLAGLRVHRVEDAGDAVVIVRRAGRRRRAAAVRSASARVHGGYARMVADGRGRAAGADRLAGPPVPLHEPGLPGGHVRRAGRGAERRYRRRSVPLLGMLAGFGLELAGRAAARLAGTLGIAVHPPRCCAWSRQRRSRRSRPRRRYSGSMTSRWPRARCTGRCWWTCAPGT